MIEILLPGCSIADPHGKCVTPEQAGNQCIWNTLLDSLVFRLRGNDEEVVISGSKRKSDSDDGVVVDALTYAVVAMSCRIRTTSSAPAFGFNAVRAMPETTRVMLWSTVSGVAQTSPCGAVM